MLALKPPPCRCSILGFHLQQSLVVVREFGTFDTEFNGSIFVELQFGSDKFCLVLDLLSEKQRVCLLQFGLKYEFIL